ncbi:BCCT family transporter [Actinopolyspora xinjiangensis]|uniref:BCCT family transporter n=1 Tax=Actinopolyspora xinjiangensis TaxID=405564 RepID=A0A1H0WM01_9ACTN|nr:hypothetical protein [Actinopolyspora xinjiangensis]SDP91658.1 BCCT family transporter [Actinopolyspora xinjiangensis]
MVVPAAVSIALMYAGGLEALQTLPIITAFLLIFVPTLVVEPLRWWLRDDVKAERAVGDGTVAPRPKSRTSPVHGNRRRSHAPMPS